MKTIKKYDEFIIESFEVVEIKGKLITMLDTFEKNSKMFKNFNDKLRGEKIGYQNSYIDKFYKSDKGIWTLKYYEYFSNQKEYSKMSFNIMRKDFVEEIYNIIIDLSNINQIFKKINN